MADALRETPTQAAADAPQPQRAPRGRLFRKYAAFFVAVVTVALLANGAFEIWFSYQDHEASLIGIEREEAQGAAGKIEQFVGEIESQIGWTTELPWSAATLDQRRFDALRLLRQVPAITELSQLDASGKEQLRVSRLEMDVVGSGTDYSHDPRFTDAVAKKAWFGPVYFRRESEPYMTLSLAGARRDAGVSVAEVNLKFIWDVVSAIKIGKHGLAYVVDGDGRLIAHPDISLVLRNTSLARLPQVAAALRGAPQQTLREASDPSGKRVLTAWAKIAPMGWYVFVELPLDEANAPLFDSIERAGALFAGCLLLAFLAALFLARRMAVPIEALRAGAARIGGGDLAQRISIKTGDELESLADQFNDMAGRLADSYAGLERKVEARTQELSQSLERQTATSEVLGVISSSPGELRPVFETMLENAVRLCEASAGLLFLLDGDVFRVAAVSGLTSAFTTEHGRDTTTAALLQNPKLPTARVLLSGQTVHIPDLSQDADAMSGARVRAVVAAGVRTTAYVPMLKEGHVVGLFALARQEVRPFSASQIELVENFAKQAVIAIENARLLSELRESLDRQTATSDILRVIASTPGDPRRALDTIAETAARMFDAASVAIRRAEGDVLRGIAFAGPAASRIGQAIAELRIDDANPFSQSVRENRQLHFADFAQSVPAFGSDIVRLAAEMRLRTTAFTPLTQEGRAIGGMAVLRDEVRPFRPDELELMRGFADQAVIAIENARLLSELRESLDRQTATSEVLSVISASPGELKPVFETMLANALRLCEAAAGTMYLRDGDGFRVAETLGMPSAFAEIQAHDLIHPHPDTGLGRALGTHRTVHIPDLLSDAAHRHGSPRMAALDATVRSLLVVPMLQENELIGAISMYRHEVRPFEDKQIELVENFAKQAVIAIENARLLSELRESLDRQTATSEVLSVISASPGELKPVFDSMLANALRLCEGQSGVLLRYDGDMFETAAVHGIHPDFAKVWLADRFRMSPDTNMGRMLATRDVVHDLDLAASPGYLARSPMPVAGVEIGGVRTGIHVPMLKEGAVVGAFIVLRTEVRAFADKQVDLLRNFAAQAVIAIENARLLSELRESLDRQTATSEVLSVISASPGELKPVFNVMLENALRLCESQTGILLRYDGEAFETMADVGLPEELADYWRRNRIFMGPETNMGRMLSTKDVVHNLDLAQSPGYLSRLSVPVLAVEAGGVRTNLSVPMLKDDEVVGAFITWRTEVRPYTEKQIELVENFAAQAVIAIENARLLSELRESLDRQTATSEVLGVIASSPGRLEPVFDTILENALRLCETDTGHIARIVEGGLHVVALRGAPTEFAEFVRGRTVRVSPGTHAGRAIAEKRPVETADLRQAPQYLARNPMTVAAVELAGVRTVLYVPIIRGEETIGLITIYRRDVRAFLPKHIALVENFAKQAVIAIENARLLSELRESLDRQTATSEVLGVISASPGELDPVFAAMLGSAVRLCEAAQGGLWRIENGTLYRLAERNQSTIVAAFPQGFVPPPDSAPGRMLAAKATVHIGDLVQLSDPASQTAAAAGGIRTALWVPMLRDEAVVGAFSLARNEVRPFNNKQVELIENFAAQAVIAIENARLLSELRERTGELARSVEELGALGEVSQAVNSSLDLQTVLTTIVTNSVRLSATDAGAIYVYDEGADEFALRATFGMDERLIAAIRGQHIRFGAAGIGEAAERRAPVQIPDLRAGERSAITEIIVEAGFRALLVMPLLRPDRVVGALVVRRRAPGEFAAATVDLLQTLAAQSVAAIENARLFGEIEEKSRELVIASQHKSQFLANMSHELRTPLNAILGYTELILDDIYGAAPPRMREVMERVQTNGKHLLGLINDVLDLSKIEAGQLTLQLAPYSVKDMLQGVYVAVEPLASTKKIALKLDLAKDLPAAKGDERRLSQVVLNLVGNAIKFTDVGSVTIAATAGSGAVLVQVKDTGPGIAAADQQKIFEEFQQADNSATRAKGGTGLGLAISRRIVALHGGRLWVESALGKGSTFSVSLPVTVERQVETA